MTITSHWRKKREMVLLVKHTFYLFTSCCRDHAAIICPKKRPYLLRFMRCLDGKTLVAFFSWIPESFLSYMSIL